MAKRAPKKFKKQKSKTPSGFASGTAASETPPISLLDPKFTEMTFNDFGYMAKGFDALIAEFYDYYRKHSGDEPNMFGLVSVTHRVEFIKTSGVSTSNAVGEKTTIIYAPIKPGETIEEREAREISLLAAFDHTKRASHILALSLIFRLLGKGLDQLIAKHQRGGAA